MIDLKWLAKELKDIEKELKTRERKKKMTGIWVHSLFDLNQRQSGTSERFYWRCDHAPILTERTIEIVTGEPCAPWLERRLNKRGARIGDLVVSPRGAVGTITYDFQSGQYMALRGKTHGRFGLGKGTKWLPRIGDFLGPYGLLVQAEEYVSCYFYPHDFNIKVFGMGGEHLLHSREQPPGFTIWEACACALEWLLINCEQREELLG